MSDRIKIIVFGLRDEACGGGGGCNCSGGDCGPTPTTGEQFAELKSFLAKTDIGDRIELQFIDVFEDGIDGHEKVKMFMDRGYSLPLISIDDQKFFYGAISNQLIYDTAKELLK